MDWTINNGLLVVCIFYFLISAFLSYLFREANIFFKLILFVFVVSVLLVLERINRIEVTLSAVAGFGVIYNDFVLGFLLSLQLWLGNLFSGFFEMLRRFFRFILQPIANLFTGFYNLLSRLFGWNRVFIPLGQKAPPKIYVNKPDRKSRRNHQNTQHRQQNQPVSHTHSQGSSRYQAKGNQAYKPSNQSGQRSFADKQKQDNINQAKAQIKQARELATKQAQQQNNGGSSGDRSY